VATPKTPNKCQSLTWTKMMAKHTRFTRK